MPSLRASRICHIVLTLLTSVALQGPTPLASQQTIHVNVERVNVGVIVTDWHGRFVSGLGRENFRIIDNGTEQPIIDFSSVNDPAQILLLVEAGPAVYLLQDMHVLTAAGLLHGLAPDDRVAVASYADALSGILDFTTDKSAAQTALDKIQFNLGFGELNLATSLNAMLNGLDHVPGKKTVVLISTGVDTSLQNVIRSVQTRLEVSDVRLFCVSVSGPLRNGKTANRQAGQGAEQEFRSADVHLNALATATGGRTFFPKDAKDLQETYVRIAQLVRHKYSLTFRPPTADGAIHRIDVSVEQPPSSGGTQDRQQRVDHRKAYLAPEPPVT